MRRRGLIRAGVLAGLCGVAKGTLAHTMQYTTTQLRWQVNSQSWEIYHAFHLDDALVLLSQLGDPLGMLEVETRAKVLHYVEKKFALMADGQALDLDPVGTQIDGNYLWVYQEYRMPTLPQQIDVRCQFLHELYPDQQNQINLVIGEHVRSVRTRVGAVLGSFNLMGLELDESKSVLP